MNEQDVWSARLTWLSHPPDGRAQIHGASGAFTTLPMSLGSSPDDQATSSPGEILAAAYAAGFAAAVSFALEARHTAAREITVTAECFTLGEARTRRLTAIDFHLHARVEGVDQASADAALAGALAHCRDSLGLDSRIELNVRAADFGVA